MHNNRATSQLGVGIDEVARNFLCDGDVGTGMNGCEIYNNYVNTNDGRAVRFRDVNSGVNTTTAHDNLVDNIAAGTSGNYIAAFHLCDPDSGTNDGSSYDIFNNTLKFTSGNGIMARSCTGFPKFRNNTLTCLTTCAGLLGNVRQGFTTINTLQLSNNNPVPLISSPQTDVEINSIIQICNSGSVGGTGAINFIPCP
jgi:hypothetical protein